MASNEKDFMYEFSDYDEFLGHDDDDHYHHLQMNQGSIIGGHAGLIQVRTPKLEHYPSSSYSPRRDGAQDSESYHGQAVRALFQNTDRKKYLKVREKLINCNFLSSKIEFPKKLEREIYKFIRHSFPMVGFPNVGCVLRIKKSDFQTKFSFSQFFVVTKKIRDDKNDGN